MNITICSWIITTFTEKIKYNLSTFVNIILSTSQEISISKYSEMRIVLLILTGENK